MVSDRTVGCQQGLLVESCTSWCWHCEMSSLVNNPRAAGAAGGGETAGDDESRGVSV